MTVVHTMLLLYSRILNALSTCHCHLVKLQREVFDRGREFLQVSRQEEEELAGFNRYFHQ